jgi:MoxR-like ATPase
MDNEGRFGGPDPLGDSNDATPHYGRPDPLNPMGILEPEEQHRTQHDSAGGGFARADKGTGPAVSGPDNAVAANPATQVDMPAASPGKPVHTQRVSEALRREIAKAVVGQDAVIELMLTTVFAGGHLLFEGVPGLAKTLLVKTLAVGLGGEFSRIQFTPDLLPSDITGTNIYDMNERNFSFRRGPIFGDFVLADEVNRTPPKTQAALLEAMEERVVTVDGVHHQLSASFTVFATQNPVEYEGTYPLPEAQLDRFLLKVNIDYPQEQEERSILQRYDQGFNPHDVRASGLRQVVSADELQQVAREVNGIRVEEGVLNYIVSIVRASRRHRSIALGASPRAGIALLKGAKALSALRGKNYITPDEVLSLAPSVLRHRILLTPESEIEGGMIDSVVASLVGGIPVPR